MEKLFQIFQRRLRNTTLSFKRYLINKIDWSDRLIAIRGARGVGKTTLILQYIKEKFKTVHRAIDPAILYASLDDIYFQANSLIDLTDEFAQQGGKFLFLDEVHKYPKWSIEIKNIYDNYPELNVVFTGSSILEIYRGDADLSRRAITYELHGLSFREFFQLERNLKFETHNLQDILQHHLEISQEVLSQTKPLALFKNYLNYGYYPYFVENKDNYLQRLSTVINLTIESDLPAVHHMDYTSIGKLKKLLYIVATSVPFKPNIAKISEKIEASRGSTLRFLEYLKNAHILNLLRNDTEGISYLSKPEKVYLNNTNVMYALASENVNIGNLRETFFYNQLNHLHAVTHGNFGDFLIDKKFTFEVGGKDKGLQQIKGMENAYIAADNIESGFGNKIPLWLFGFLY